MAKIKKFKLLRLTAATAIMAAFAAACAGVSELTVIAKWQLIPVLLRFFAGAVLGAIVPMVLFVLLTLLFGRWYCALWCPLGTFFDLADLIPFRWKNGEKRNFQLLRLSILTLCLALAFAGINSGFKLLDPYSNFGRIVGELPRLSFSTGMVIPLMIFLVFAIWKRRFYCTSICPAGSCFNLLSQKSLFKLQILSEKCVKCRKCEKSCPAGAIDIASQTLDNARCIRCLACLDECNFKALKFGKVLKTPVETDISRREFIKRSSAALSGAVAGGVMLKLGMDKFAPSQPFSQILPPGAGDLKRFSAKCTSCLICVQNCPANIIRPALGGDGPVSLDIKKDFCRWDCNMCSAICPTGALKELSIEEKQQTGIALANVEKNCISCGKCASVCPAGAITAVPGGAAAKVNPESCTGCGKCSHNCPVKAIIISPVKQQRKVKSADTAAAKPAASETPKAEINFKSCFSCGSCAEICPVKAITLSEDDTPLPVDKTKCIGCGKCVSKCPAKAITLK